MINILTTEEVQDICVSFMRGATIRDLSRYFNQTEKVIKAILARYGEYKQFASLNKVKEMIVKESKAVKPKNYQDYLKEDESRKVKDKNWNVLL